ncbi:sigma-54-dependent Fis family transcriptional regulator [Rhodococcus opacus]|uniref:sigma-54-dependent Fis family transcriptional regulator n=1 Tax=Rhodococcus opacus TaxID=37919 RepID=UPI001C46E87A|nr:helix-turn-helix domain-containing protein [Rhodococcus opacus]MBV6756124.1 sigma-54-dependent Fis family transcriptional regulator [Rhodococcus opacus]
MTEETPYEARVREPWPGRSDPKSGAAARSEIVTSWRRSQLSGVVSGAEDLPFNPNLNRTSRLVTAATPVIDRLAAHLDGGGATIVLADSNAQIIDRRAGGSTLARALDRAMVAPGFSYAEEHAGTNGIGSVIEGRRPIMVSGTEHFRENLQQFTCVGSPVVNPFTNSIVGVLDVTSRLSDTSELMTPLVVAAAREIETRLLADSSRREQLLLEQFLARAKRSSAAVVTLNEDFIITNTAASRLLEPTDHAVLWNWTARTMGSGEYAEGELCVGDDVPVRAQARMVRMDDKSIGVLIELRVHHDLHRAIALAPPSPGVTLAAPGAGATHDPLAGLPPGRSAVWQRARREIACTAGLDESVLVTGEPGTGKRCVAEALVGGRPSAVLDAMAVDRDPAAWISKAEDVLTDGGHLVVTHIDALPVPLCGSLIALMKESAARGGRIIATATRLDFRVSRIGDHFPVRLHLPALRERPEDLADIVPFLLDGRPTLRQRMLPSTLQALMALAWPGNLRELHMVLTSAAVRANGVDLALQHLPYEYRAPSADREPAALKRAERETILDALSVSAGNKKRAADRLGIARSTLYRKMRALGIDEKRWDTCDT